MFWRLPSALLLLAGAIPLILFLHSLKPRGLQVRTTTFFLWERVLKEQPLGTRIGWLLRKNLLLILQLLAAVALIAALADPGLRYFGPASGDVVAVIDLSASMKAAERGVSRFDAARREWLSLIDSLGSGQKMMVIGAGPQPRLLLPFTSDQRRLRELARGLEPTDAPATVKDAILFAHAFLKRGSLDRVVVISDGAFSGAEDFAKPGDQLRFIRVTGGKDNVGIVGFETRRPAERSGPAEIMIHVKNFTERALRAPLALTLDGRTLAQQEIELGALDRRVLIFSYDGPLEGGLLARLDLRDDFATDNQAYLALSERAPVRLLYVGPGNPYLDRLLRLFAHVQVSSAPQWDSDLALRKDDFDVIVFDRVPAPALGQGNFILIDSLAPDLPLRLEGRIRNPRVISPPANHPLTTGISLGDLTIHEAARVAPKGEGTVLARSAESPLIYALDKSNLRVLFLGFDLLASDLPLRVAFPVLLHNALDWFKPQRLEFPGQSAQAGTPMILRLPNADAPVEIIAPSGRRESFGAQPGPFVFGDTFQAGFYAFKNAGRGGRFAVNLFDEAESEILPRAQPASGSDRQPPAAGTAASGFSLWPGLLAAVVMVLGLELFLAARQGLPIYPIAARAAALALIAAALLNPPIFHAATALDVIVGVDLSRSVGQEGREKAQSVLEAAQRFKNAAVRTGLLAFARAPEWEALPREQIPAIDFAARLDRDQTDVQAALQAALAQVGEGRQGKILLISDGNENRGDIARVMPLLRAQDVQVWTLPVSLSRGRNEAYLSELSLPRLVDSAEGFEVRGVIESLRAAPARVRLLRDGVLHAERELKLKPGSNPLSFRDSLSERGNHSYELLIESADDTLAENNLLQGVVAVKGPPRVLLLSADKDSQRVISRVLQVQGYAVVEAAPHSHALSLSELSAYDLLVLDNVPAFQLTHAKMENVEKYVRDLGGGVLVIGGAQSYGAGGYFRTPLERILPVDMRPPARLEMPHVALLFVIDKSGSMGAGSEGNTKLDLAKAAAIAAADIMNPTDQVGILAFDANWDWALPFRQVGKGEWISEKLSALQSDGGTDLYKAMIEAHRAIAAKQAAIKHAIVLSDGLTDKADFQTLVQKMVRDGITVSTVSVGNDADVPLMADIAKNGRGRGYVALDPQTIPQIFTAETLLIARDLLIEKTVTPTIVAPSGPLKGIAQNSLPALRGYVLTYPKARAELLMQADKDPLLVSWRYGLGQVMAFTSDLSGRWGRDWVSWPGFPQWASQLARGTMRKILETRMRTEFLVEGDAIRVVTDVSSPDGRFLNHLELGANITVANQPSQERSFRQSAPGRYEAKFVPATRGIHFLSLYAEANPSGPAVPLGTVPYVAPYPKEYRELKPNLSLLSRLAEQSGGEMLDSERFEDGLRRLYTPSPGKGRQRQEVWWPLAGAALFLFLGDLVLRQWRGRSGGAESTNMFRRQSA
jgi:Mg-chelatase subunit ChlD/CheY-like chemotaxis protein